MFNCHQKWMKQAFLEALRSKGTTGKNPNVGCVIVKDNQIIGRGRTSVFGRPHAEENALRSISNSVSLNNSYMYLSLEPCAHKNNKQSSCAELVSKSGIKNVFISNVDPDPRTSGRGIKKLIESGINVVTGILEKEGKAINAGFFSRINKRKPFITLKVAISIDGKIALINNNSKWITNQISRNYSHLLRSQTDAILTSSNTILYDNSQLTCRLNGLSQFSPLKIVIDRNLKLTKSLQVFNSFFGEKTVIYYEKENKKLINSFEHNNVTFRNINSFYNKEKGFWLSILNDICEFGVNNLLIESGPKFNNSLFKQKLIDEISLFRSDKLIGNDGVPFLGNLQSVNIVDLHNYELIESRSFDSDIYELRRLVK